MYEKSGIEKSDFAFALTKESKIYSTDLDKCESRSAKDCASWYMMILKKIEKRSWEWEMIKVTIYKIYNIYNI